MKKLINFKRATRPRFLLLVFILVTTNAWAQQRTITGTVTSGDGHPLPGATIVVKGTTIGTVTDGTGTFTIELPENSQELQVSFIGMRSKDVNVKGLSTVTIWAIMI